MSKIRKIFGLSMLGLSSLGLIASADFLINQKVDYSITETYADTKTSFSNNLPDYFSVSDGTDNNLRENPLFLQSGSNELEISFATKEVNRSSDTTKKAHLYIPDENTSSTWQAFNFSPISLKRDGVIVNFSDTSTPYKTTQTDEPYADGVLTEKFELKIKLDSSKEAVGFDETITNLLYLKDEGLYELSIPYIEFSTTDNGESFESEPKVISYKFFVFNHTTYLASEIHSPVVNFQGFERSNTEQSTLYELSYFYHYNAISYPYLQFDKTKYDLTITKDFNLETATYKISYNNEIGDFSSFDKSEFDVVPVENSNDIRLYFYNVGQYVINFDLVYTTATFEKYTLPTTVKKQAVYMFGYQSTYTAYDKQTKKNVYKEFRSKNDFNTAADVTNNILNSTVTYPVTEPSSTKQVKDLDYSTDLKSALTAWVNDSDTPSPVSTNQVPVKFKENAKFDSAKMFTVTKDSATSTLTGPTEIPSSKNISTPGTYIVAIKYTFENYNKNGIATPNQDFYQFFYFEIKNTTPTITVQAVDKSTEPETKVELSSGEYTNKDVYIKLGSDSDNGEFDSETYLFVERYDYENRKTERSQLGENSDELNPTKINDDEYAYVFTDNGNYTIEIYYGKLGTDGTPITRKFNIDKMDIESLKAHAVTRYGTTSNYRIYSSSEIESITNQPIVFSWETEKLSGAKTFGYYKYYALTQSSYLDVEGFDSTVLSQFIQNNKTIPVGYELNLSNQTPSWINYTNLNDGSNKEFFSSSYVRSGAGIYLFSVYDEAGNLTTNLYMLDNTTPRFVINEPKEDGSADYSFVSGTKNLSRDATVIWSENKSIKYTAYSGEDIYKNIKGISDSSIEEKVNSFFSQYVKNIVSVKAGFQSTYIQIPIDEKVLYSSLGNSTAFNFDNMSEHSIRSSYGLYYTENSGVYTYYFSTTQGRYIKIPEGVSPNNANIDELDSYENYVYANMVPNIKEYDNSDGKNYKSTYNLEGSYQFLIRDKSNTLGVDDIERNRYLNYPSAYQTIILTSDASLLTVGYKQTPGDEDLQSLLPADSVSVIDETNSKKNSYYHPTNIETLFVSFIPTIDKGNGKTYQVSKVTVDFYPFEEKYSSYVNASGETTINYYRTLSNNFTSRTLYEYHDGDQAVETVQIYELNQENGKTVEGKYVITRTYVQVNGENNIPKYDFQTRVLSVIVDRDNIISEPQVISGTTKVFEFKDGEENLNATIKAIGKSLYVKPETGFGVSSLNINGQSVTFDNSKEINGYYYMTSPVYAEEITSVTINDTEITTFRSEIKQSTESVVGNGLVVSMFAGDALNVNIPTYLYTSEENLGRMNSGYSFYLKLQNFEADTQNKITSLSSIFTTDKLPFRLYIPEYKYTYNKQQNDTNYTFSTEKNPSLSAFHDDASIEYFEIYAEIFINGHKVAESLGSENGYLKFIDLNGASITNFTQPGTYSVILTQAQNSVGVSTSFKNNYAFRFDVESTKPKFEIYGEDGKLLDGPNTNLSSLEQGDIVYTNQKSVTIKWTDSQDDYMANIDLRKIKINDTEYNLLDEPNNVEFASHSYILATKEHALTIDIEKLGKYRNEESFNVAFVLEHPESSNDLYEFKSRNIFIDTTIYSNNKTTVEELYEKFRTPLNVDITSIREFFDVNGTRITNFSNETVGKISYSSTASDGFYKNYNFVVESDFASILKSRLGTTGAGVIYAYIRKISTGGSINQDYSETTYSNFFTSNPSLTNLKQEDYTLTAGEYYEIVECDYAGNILIYQVLCKDENSQSPLSYKTSPEKEAISLSNREISSNKYNIYSNSMTASLDNVSIYGDPWTLFKVSQNGVETTYMTNPAYSGGNVINRSTGNVVNLNSIISNNISANKTKISILDRYSGNFYTVFFGKSNTSNLQFESLTDSQEGISISVPSEDVQTNSKLLVFPVEIKISLKRPADTNYQQNPLTLVNDPNRNLTNSNYNYQSDWQDDSGNWEFSYNSASKKLILSCIADLDVGTKVKYEITDNFGKTYPFIHIFGTNFSEDITYVGNVYNYFDNEKPYYLTSNGIKYSYNYQIYHVELFYGTGQQVIVNDDNFVSFDRQVYQNKEIYSFSCSDKQVNQKYELRIYEAEGTQVNGQTVYPYLRSVYIHLYNYLPRLTNGANPYVRFTDENGNDLAEKFSTETTTVYLNGTAYSAYTGITFADIVSINFTNPSSLPFPYAAYLIKQGENGLSEAEEINNNYKIREEGIYYILFKYTSTEVFTNEHILFRLEIKGSSSSFFYVAIDGLSVKQQDSFYEAKATSKQYSNYYIVNVSYENRSRVKLVTNEYQKVNASLTDNGLITESNSAITAIYLVTNKLANGTFPQGVSPYTDYVVITYVAPTNTPVKHLTYTDVITGAEVGFNPTTTIVSSDYEFDKLKITWDKYNGIIQNKISIYAEKEGYSYSLPTYYQENYAYTYLTISGSYKLRFQDAAGNVQLFGGQNYLSLTFLKDVHFTMITTQIDDEGNEVEVETEAIDRGVFNGSVKLKVKNISAYYTAQTVGSRADMIHVTRNGENFNDFDYNQTDAVFTFNKVGYYKIYFTATALTNNKEIRQQEYSFTIINPNESRYAYEFAQFSNYMIEKVTRDRLYVEDLSENLSGKNLLVSYYDNATGDGLWTVKINTSEKLTLGSDETTRFTFKFLIRKSTPPIEVSVEDGATSSRPITVSFNAENIFNTVGDCIIRLDSRTSIAINSENYSEIGVRTLTINNAGTYYIQVLTESGRLMYSYKVTKVDPMNAWTIIAIVLGGVVAVAVIFIVIKLRKRIKVK